jgi:GT2 family glycosyltransferase
MDLSIIIVNWNTRDYLIKCINSIYENLDRISQKKVEIMVVDNASTDGSADAVLEKYPEVILLSMDTNLGFARSNNIAARQSHGEFLIFINPDTVVHPPAISILFNYLSLNHTIGAVGPRILNQDGSVQISIWPKPTLFRECWRLFHLDRLIPISQYPDSKIYSKNPQPVDVMSGAFFVIRRSVFEVLGGFDEQFFIYSEEIDLFVRMESKNWLLFLIPDATVTHYVGQSTRQVSDDMFIELYRNKLKFFRKHFGGFHSTVYKWVLFVVSISRILFGYIISKSPVEDNQKYEVMVSQYRKLFKDLQSN